MINEYVYVSDEIQNSDEVTKQKIVIEELNESLKDLKLEKDRLKKIKNNFFEMLFNDKSGIKTVSRFLFSILLIIVQSIGMTNIVLQILTAILLFSVIPFIVVDFKNYRKSKELELINIEQQIIEFESILEEEKLKLIDLEFNNTKNNKNKNSNINDKLNKINRRKWLYEVYRENALKIKEMMEKGNIHELFDDTCTFNDISDIKEMYKESNIVLVKNSFGLKK